MLKYGVRPATWAHKSHEEALKDGSAASFFSAALPWIRIVKVRVPTLFISVGLAQIADEQGYFWPPRYNNPGNVGDPVSAGQRGYSTLAAGFNAYASTLLLPYYVNVRAQRDELDQCYALGQSPYAGGHYDAAGGPPGEDLVKIVNNFNLTQYDGGAPGPGPSPSPSPSPTNTVPTEPPFMIPTGCTDTEAIKAQIKEWWIFFRTDTLTTEAINDLLYVWKLPVANGGFGGSPFELLSNIRDGSAQNPAPVRPIFAGTP